jgi:succinyl-CoA synthetase beta subunit
MSIEDVAHNTPEKIHKLYVDPRVGLDIDYLLEAAIKLDLKDYKT